MNFACGRGHIVAAADLDYKDLNLEGHMCPVCLGAVDGHGDIIDTRMLAPLQESASK